MCNLQEIRNFIAVVITGHATSNSEINTSIRFNEGRWSDTIYGFTSNTVEHFIEKTRGQ